MECGVDIIEIDRIKEAIERNGDTFVKKIYTPKEIEYCNSKGVQAYASFAARFATKEAVAKLLQTGFDGSVNWKEIEVNNTASGAPQVVLYGDTKLLAEKKGLQYIKVSLSHSRESAISMVIGY